MINYAVFETKEDWSKFRAGLFTASEVHRLMSEPKKKDELLSVGAKTYILERISEIIAPPEPNYYNSAMEHGNETEPFAVIEIAKKLQKDIDDDDFIYTSTNGFVFFWDDEYDLGGTPDVIIRNNMICEIKCPTSKTHLEYLMLKTPEDIQSEIPKYYAQMQLNMYLTKLDKCLFVSFDNRFYNEDHHYHAIEVPKDEEFIDRMLKKAKIAKKHKNLILETINKKELAVND